MKKLLVVLSIVALSTSVYSKEPERSLKSAITMAYKLLSGKTQKAENYSEALRKGLLRREAKLAFARNDFQELELKIEELKLQVNDSKENSSQLVELLLSKKKLERDILEEEQNLEDFISVIEGYDPSILE